MHISNVTKKEIQKEIERLQKMLEKFYIRPGDNVVVNDCSYSAILKDKEFVGYDFNILHQKTAKVLVYGYGFPVPQDCWSLKETNDTLIEYDGNLYAIQARFLEKV